MENYVANRVCGCMRCRARTYMGPAVMVTLGVLFLLETLNVPRADFHSTWPILLIVIGVVKVLQFNASTEGHSNPRTPMTPGQAVSGPATMQDESVTRNSGQVENA